MRAGARGCAVDLQTVLQGLGAAADHRPAFSQDVLHDVRGPQGPLDALCALRRAGKTGAVSDAEAVERLARSPHGVGAASDPVPPLLRTVEVGPRTRARAQRVVHQVVQVRAPSGVPLFLPEGCKESTTVLLPPYGPWVQPARQRAHGPAPHPRWRPWSA
jgi:hypothetical protein